MAVAKPWLYFSVIALFSAANLSHATLSGADRKSNYVEYDKPVILTDLTAKGAKGYQSIQAGYGGMVSSKKQANGKYSVTTVYPQPDTKTVYCRSSETHPGNFYPAYTTPPHEHILIAASLEPESLKWLKDGEPLEQCLNDISTQGSGYVCYSESNSATDIINLRTRQFGFTSYNTDDECREAVKFATPTDICVNANDGKPVIAIAHNDEIAKPYFDDFKSCNEALANRTSASTAGASASAGANDTTAEAGR